MINTNEQNKIKIESNIKEVNQELLSKAFGEALLLLTNTEVITEEQTVDFDKNSN